jgi:hypothetical protein
MKTYQFDIGIFQITLSLLIFSYLLDIPGIASTGAAILLGVGFVNSLWDIIK